MKIWCKIHVIIYPLLRFKHGCKIYVDIMTGENYRQFSLLTRNSFIGQFVHPIWMGVNGINEVEGEIFILAHCMFHIRVHVNMVQHPSNNISITIAIILFFV